MAEYNDKLKVALKEAMKSKDTARRDTIRSLQSAFKQVQIDEQKELSEQDELKILQKEAKRRKESIAELEEAGRDPADEQFELEVIESFMPQMLSRDEIEKMVDEAIQKTGASTPKDMGKVIGMVVGQAKGLADGSLVSEVAREKLSE